jgi:simple sugar transport system ATP-binding protein
VLYISHKLEEVRRICEAATILRHGKVVARCDPRAESAASLARMMVGTEVGSVRHDAAEPSGPVRLAVSALSMPPAEPHGTALRSVSLAVHRGEILGIAGVAGNGQEELFAALSGERLAPAADAIALDGSAVGREDINARRRRGAAFVPEERLGHAAAPRLTLSENALVAGHAANGFVARGFLDRGRMLGWVDAVTKTFDVRKGPRDPEARALSGGNLQKFVVGREMLRRPGVLVVAQPTWGVDAGAAQLIRQSLVGPGEGRRRGAGDQPGPRRAAGDLGPHRGDLPRPPVRRPPGARRDAGGARPADGRLGLPAEERSAA